MKLERGGDAGPTRTGQGRKAKDVFVTGLCAPEVHSDFARFRLKNGEDEVGSIVMTLEAAARCLRLVTAALSERLFTPLNG